MTTRRSLVAVLVLFSCLACRPQTPPATSATPLPTCTPIPTPRPGGLYVDVAATRGPISQLTLGTNSGPWMAVPYELIPHFEDSGLTLLRYPGGNWGDSHNLLAPHIDSLRWQVEQIQAEPLVHVRLRNGSPESAAEVVRLCAQRGLNVRFWSIGNEPNLYASAGEEYDTVRFNREWREFALAMRAADPTIRLVGPDTNQFTGDPAVDPRDAAGRDWLREFLRANGDLVDVVAIHRYPFPGRVGAGPPSVDELLADAERWDEIIRNLRAIVRETTGRDLPVAVTEFNSSWASTAGGETTPDSFYNALWLAEVLSRLIREGTEIAAHFALHSGSGSGGLGLLANYEVRPSYYVYQMYKQLGGERLYASSAVPHLSILAAQREDGALTLLVVNLNREPTRQRLTLDHFAPEGKAEVLLFDEHHPAVPVAAVAVTGSFEYEFPAASVTLLTVPGTAAP